jgi:hypothetical protein
MRITIENIVSVCDYPEFRAVIMDELKSIGRKELPNLGVDDLNKKDYEYLEELCTQLLMHSSPVVKTVFAEQEKGLYEVCICGIKGAYFVRAGEYPDSELFSNFHDAEKYLLDNFGRFLKN